MILHQALAQELLREAKGNYDLAIVAAQRNRAMWRVHSYYWNLYRLAAEWLREQRRFNKTA